MPCWLFFFIGDSFRCLEEAAWERDWRGWPRLTQKTKKAEPLDSDELACPGADHLILRGTPRDGRPDVGATPVLVPINVQWWIETFLGIVGLAIRDRAELFISDYSYRSATMGSTFAARRAGT